MIFEASNAKLKQNLNPRRFGIHAQRTHIFGAPQSGKTSIALNYARNFKNPLYIDFADLRNSRDLIGQTLLKIAFEKTRDLLILDNIPRDFANHFTNLPKGANIITISESNADLSGFERLEILPLNFEEFISFDTQGLNLKELFERFIKFGNLPIMLNSQHLSMRDFAKLEAKQKMLVFIMGENMDIFSVLTRFQANALSIFQLYNILKKDSKMSKNRIYGVIDEFEKRGIVRFVAHCDKPKAPKKAFLFDFSLRNAISYERNFMASFENMVFLELLGRESSANQRESSGKSLERESNPQKNCAEIFYSDKIPLICGKNGYIVMPFKSKGMIVDALKGVDFMGLEIAVLTIDLNDEIVICGKKIPLISFINFALD
ncbi:hypothetical protein [Helicobacter sp. 23-1045]